MCKLLHHDAYWHFLIMFIKYLLLNISSVAIPHLNMVKLSMSGKNPRLISKENNIKQKKTKCFLQVSI